MTDEIGSPLLVRLRPFFGPGVGRKWYLFLGHIQGVAPDGRRNERVRIFVPSLVLDLSVPWNGISPKPPTQNHRLPASWLTQYLYSPPLDFQGRGCQFRQPVFPEKWGLSRVPGARRIAETRERCSDTTMGGSSPLQKGGNSAQFDTPPRPTTTALEVASEDQTKVPPEPPLPDDDS